MVHHVLLGIDAYMYNKEPMRLYIIDAPLKKHPLKHFLPHLRYKQIFGLFLSGASTKTSARGSFPCRDSFSLYF